MSEAKPGNKVPKVKKTEDQLLAEKELSYAQKMMEAYMNNTLATIDVLVDTSSHITDKLEFADYAREHPQFSHLLNAIWEGKSYAYICALIMEDIKIKGVASYDFRIQTDDTEPNDDRDKDNI